MAFLDFIFKYWIEIFFGIITSMAGYLYKKLKTYYNLLEATTNGVKVLLKGEIIRRYNENKKTGEITLFDKEIINELYKEYRNLGGNGLVSEFVNEINDIPLSISGGD